MQNFVTHEIILSLKIIVIILHKMHTQSLNAKIFKRNGCIFHLYNQ